jgi:hypothetical protein
MNSSASILGCLTEPRLREEVLPSLNDPETESGAGVAISPPSPETSAIDDLTEISSSLAHIQMHAIRDLESRREMKSRLYREQVYGVERESVKLKMVDLERES